MSTKEQNIQIPLELNKNAPPLKIEKLSERQKKKTRKNKRKKRSSRRIRREK